jgi:hypothetical protein
MDEAATILFHALKYNRSIKVLKINRAKFQSDGFKQLGLLLQHNMMLNYVELEDLEHLGVSVP